MIADKMKPLMENNSAIRTMFEEGDKMRAEYGPENVYDFSLGNPDAPVPAEVKQSIIDIPVSYTHLDVYKRQGLYTDVPVSQRNR